MWPCSILAMRPGTRFGGMRSITDLPSCRRTKTSIRGHWCPAPTQIDLDPVGQLHNERHPARDPRRPRHEHGLPRGRNGVLPHPRLRGSDEPHRTLVRLKGLQLGCNRGLLNGETKPHGGSKTTVGEGGLEPPRSCDHRNLNPARLPIPPRARGNPMGFGLLGVEHRQDGIPRKQKSYCRPPRSGSRMGAQEP